MEWVGEPTRRPPPGVNSIKCIWNQSLCVCISMCIGLYRPGELGIWLFWKHFPRNAQSGEERRGGSNAFAAKYQLHIHFTNNSSKIKTKVSEAKLGFSGVARIYASWRFSRGVDYSRWSQVWVLKPDPSELLEPSCYQIFWTNLRALAKKVIDSLPFSIAPELITDTLWCAREQIWAEKNLWG